MEILLTAPALLKVLLSLGVILLVNRLTKNLPIAIFAGTVLLAFWSGQTPSRILHISWTRFSERDNLFLILIIFLIIWLSRQMSETGIMKSLVASFQSKVSNRTSIAMLPAMVGLLPMPGGALFSAPLVNDCDKDGNISPIMKVRINYWFRHIWEYWWPLYAGVLLAVESSGLEVWHFMAWGIPVTLFSVFGGWFFLLRKVEKGEKQREGKFDVSSLIPVGIVIGVYALLSMFLPVITRVSKYLPIAIGILLAMLYVQLKFPVKKQTWKTILLSGNTLNLAVLVVIIRIYGAFIEAPLPDGSFLVDLMRKELELTGIPPITLIMIIPFIAGFTTGIALGMVGASFPIVMQLAGPDPSVQSLISTAALAYSAGHMGQMVSPVHVCLIVSNEYFKTSLLKSLKGVAGPCICVLIGSIIVSRIVLLF